MLDFNNDLPSPKPNPNPTQPLDLQARRDEIRSRWLADLPQLVRRIFPAGVVRANRFLVGNVAGQPGDSLEVVLSGPKAGLWTDRATGDGGDVFDLLAGHLGVDVVQDFAQVLVFAEQWVGSPSGLQPGRQERVPEPSIKSPSTQPPTDELGPATGKWDYQDASGRLLACVYRYDPPGGKKEFRPWDARRRRHTPPEPRPLYNQPGILAAITVVLVEGEKCADALIQAGICATTAMHGAKAPVDKTDWSPLKGKTVVLWPDNDEAGISYMEAVAAKLQGLASSVQHVAPPSAKPPKWDAADAISEGFDVQTFLNGAQEVESLPGKVNLQNWRACDRFKGHPPTRRWLVQGIFPMAQPTLVAAAGGVGKSFLLLALAHSVAGFDGRAVHAPLVFGGELAQNGTAVYVTAEDDAIEVHNRLNALGPVPLELYALPLPDAGGASSLFAPDALTRGPCATTDWWSLIQQLQAMPRLALVVLDPLQPLCALDLNVPENAQFVCSRLAALAAGTGACVIVSHHFAKREAHTPEQAREAIRGTGGLVDGMRSVYALWNPKEDQARTICKALSQAYVRGGVVMGGVVKANGRADLSVTTYVRDARGLLMDRSKELELRIDEQASSDPLQELQDAIAHAAGSGKPYTKTGSNGLFERRHELPEPFHHTSKHRLGEMLDSLLAAGHVVSAMAEGSKLVKWLDVPSGPVATGQGTFEPGHLVRSQAGRRTGSKANSNDPSMEEIA